VITILIKTTNDNNQNGEIVLSIDEEQVSSNEAVSQFTKAYLNIQAWKSGDYTGVTVKDGD
jgi:hypothetical protein